MKAQLSVQDVRAIGFFLSSYEDDLRYAIAFRQFIESNQSPVDYLTKGDYSFNDFIGAFRVARNLPVKNRVKYLTKIKDKIKSSEKIDVSKFVSSVKRLTRNSHALSLASKSLMLWRPHDIYPYDQQVKDCIGYNGRDYSVYLEKVREKERELKQDAIKHLQQLQSYIAVIEDIAPQLKGIENLRYARYLDKLMWVRGKS